MSPDAMPPRSPEPGGHAPAPLLRIVSGSPTPEDVAAIVAVLASRSTPATPQPNFSLWARKSRSVRPAQRPGFGAWRASAMPR